MLHSYGFGYSGLKEKDSVLEQFDIQGYVILEGCLSCDDLKYALAATEEIYDKQVSEFGTENLGLIQELDMVRAPFLYDSFFLRQIACNKVVLDFVHKIIDGPIQLHLQNGIINRSNIVHHQTSWHRDLPYQNWVCSKPLSVSALFCLSDFNGKTGGTWVLPYSHKLPEVPTPEFIEKYKVQVNVPAGSVIVFDSMLLHCAGLNSSEKIRVGVNNMYTVPIIRQQICVSEEGFRYHPNLNAYEVELLGLKYKNPTTVGEWRDLRLKRSGRKP